MGFMCSGVLGPLTPSLCNVPTRMVISSSGKRSLGRAEVHTFNWAVQGAGEALVSAVCLSAAVLSIGPLQAEARTEASKRLAPDARPPVIADVGADLLTMCQRNIALNSHLTAARGEARRVGGRSVWQVGPAP